MAANDGEHRVTEIFPGVFVPQSTGASGSPVPPDEGPVIGNPVVTDVYDSAQVPGELGRVAVQAGDTTAGDPAAATAITEGGPGYVSTGPFPNKDYSGLMLNPDTKRYPWQQPPGPGWQQSSGG